ncbi:formyl peptide receptor-related sequence 1-like isoform X2 [Anomaloglossus baeobatrachus]|uniref:formyl peptide receptor-related sequence 1-like isoform X2 n=1 Tax=Anomaloglossus baeobatrachus TaxID=238106 RepID=UPI003F500617
MPTTEYNVALSNVTPNYNNQSNYKRTYEITQKISITLYSIVFALGIIGNGLVIWIAGFRMKNTVNAVWFLHLAIADFLCCASLPLRIAEWFPLDRNLKLPFCSVNIILFNLNINASVLLLTIISIDRWVSVMWPFWAKFHKTSKLVRIMTAIIWVLSLLLAGLVYCLFRFYLSHEKEWCELYSFKADKVIIVKFNRVVHTIRLIRFIIMCLIPFLIIITCYSTIFLKLKKSKRSKRSQRSSRIITAVILCFFICLFPYYIWPLTPPSYRQYFTHYKLNIHIINLVCLNSCINPIIYVFVGQDFQQGFFRSIPARLQKLLSDHSNDLNSKQENFDDIHNTNA